MRHFQTFNNTQIFNGCLRTSYGTWEHQPHALPSTFRIRAEMRAIIFNERSTATSAIGDVHEITHHRRAYKFDGYVLNKAFRKMLSKLTNAPFSVELDFIDGFSRLLNVL
jgi:hypothetical protein